MNNLIRCGAVRSIEKSEPDLIIKTKVYFKKKKKRGVTRILTDNLNLAPYDFIQRIVNEIEILDFAVSGHPLSIFPEIETDLAITFSNEIERKSGNKVKVEGWNVTGRKAYTKNGEFMKFITIQDKKVLWNVFYFQWFIRNTVHY